MRPAPSAFRACLLTAALLAGAALAACQSVKKVSDVNATTRVRETIGLLGQGVARIGTRAALADVNAWQRRLRAEDAPPLDDIADTLDDLEAQLQADAIDGAATGRILQMLGEQTAGAAQREGAPDRLDRLGALLKKTGERLK